MSLSVKMDPMTTSHGPPNATRNVGQHVCSRMNLCCTQNIRRAVTEEDVIQQVRTFGWLHNLPADRVTCNVGSHPPSPIIFLSSFTRRGTDSFTGEPMLSNATASGDVRSRLTIWEQPKEMALEKA